MVQFMKQSIATIAVALLGLIVVAGPGCAGNEANIPDPVPETAAGPTGAEPVLAEEGP